MFCLVIVHWNDLRMLLKLNYSCIWLNKHWHNSIERPGSTPIDSSLLLLSLLSRTLILTSFLSVCNDKASSPTPISPVTGATCGFPGQPAHGRISNQTSSSLLLPYSPQASSSLTSYSDSSSYSFDPLETFSASSSYNEGDYVYFQCDPGYYMKGRPSRRCLPNGIWSGDLPICGQYKMNRGKDPLVFVMLVLQPFLFFDNFVSQSHTLLFLHLWILSVFSCSLQLLPFFIFLFCLSLVMIWSPPFSRSCPEVH